MEEKPDHKLKKRVVSHNTGDELVKKQEQKLKKLKVSHNSRDELEEKPKRKLKRPKVYDEHIIGEQPDLKKFKEFEEPGPEDVKNIETIGPAEVIFGNLPAAEFSIGSKCRFLYKDGFWYNGEIIQIVLRDVIVVSFLNPTTPKRMICKSLLEHKGRRRKFRCKCFKEHELKKFRLPTSLVKPYTPTKWNKSLVGTTVYAAVEPAPTIWRSAVLRSWDKILKLGEVVFDEDGKSAKLGTEFLSLPPYADMPTGKKKRVAKKRKCAYGHVIKKESDS